MRRSHLSVSTKEAAISKAKYFDEKIYVIEIIALTGKKVEISKNLYKLGHRSQIEKINML